MSQEKLSILFPWQDEITYRPLPDSTWHDLGLDVLTEKIAALPEEKKKYYVVAPGRKKFKIVNAATLPRMMLGSEDPEIGAIDGLINEHDSRLRFVAKLKKTKERL